ncbi:MAG: hypothetical protein AB7L17_01990 [Ilumatobacteraceae bacterium]
MSITIGVLGNDLRAEVLPWGAVRQSSCAETLDWFVAADDRWHVPSREPTIRQVRLLGTPVVETRLRVPSGDVVHRSFCVPDSGGLVVVQVENDSPLPVAVAFAGAPFLGSRVPAAKPVPGIDLPDDARVVPIGHRAQVTVALSRDRTAGGGSLPASLPAPHQVVAGWTATVHRASRIDVPDGSLVEALVEARCDLVLGPPHTDADDPIDVLLALHHHVRMLGGDDDTVLDVAAASARLARALRRRTVSDPAGAAAALDAAEAIAWRLGDERAAADVAALRRHQIARGALDVSVRLDDRGHATPARVATTVEQALAHRGDLLPGGIPVDWWGNDFEVHGVPTEPGSSVSYAIRWHGERPAVLWETAGPGVTLTASRAAPGWSSEQMSGEALWPAPVRQEAAVASTDASASESFS